MIIFIQETISEKMERIISRSQEYNIGINSISLPFYLFVKLLAEDHSEVKKIKGAYNVNGHPNIFEYKGIEISNSGKDIIVTYENYAVEGIDPISEKINEFDTVKVGRLKSISENSNIEEIYANADEYSQLKQTEIFEHGFEGLKLQGKALEIKLGKKYYGKLLGKSVPIKII